MNSICVYCGSSPGSDVRYEAAARSLGTAIVDAGARLVYGGGKAGLMGIVADATLSRGGEVLGVIPKHLEDREIAHPGLTELTIVTSMHERKREMMDRSDGFIALPGGFGTLEELSEVLSWAQIGLHGKPVGLLDVAGFYNPLLRFFDAMVDEGFLLRRSRNLVLHDDDPVRLIARLDEARGVTFDRWAGDGD